MNGPLVKQSNKKSPFIDEAKNLRQIALMKKLSFSSEQIERISSKYNSNQLERLNKSLDKFKYGLNASAPLVCLGPHKCPFYQACPIGLGFSIDKNTNQKIPEYDNIELFPVGEQCLLEITYIENKLKDYIYEFDIDPINASELSLVNDLALVDLYKQRCILFLSAGDKQGEGADFLKADESFDLQGNIVGRTYKEHPTLQIIEKLEKRRHKILEELLATRKGKMIVLTKIKENNDDSKMLNEIEQIRKALETNNTSPIDGEIVIELN